MSLFDAFWIEALRGMMPWAAPFFSAVTMLGSANFYVTLIAIGYWTMDNWAAMWSSSFSGRKEKGAT